MLKDILKKLYHRDLNRLKNEINLYQQEENIWRVDKNIANSGGNLCLHLVGNLNTYIGAELGKTGYTRDRPLEFSAKDISRTILIQQIEDTIKMVEQVLDQISEADLKKEYPLLVFKEKTSTEYLLVHLTTHLTYHLGQINYHRRLLE